MAAVLSPVVQVAEPSLPMARDVVQVVVSSGDAVGVLVDRAEDRRCGSAID